MNASFSSPSPSSEAPFKGRWGYYPCGYETWRTIKRLRFLWFLTLRRFAAWRRWNNKQPQNRVVRRRGRVDGRRVGWETLGPRPEPALPPFMIEEQWGTRRVAHAWIDELYREARHPAPEPRPAWEPQKVAEIEELARRLEGWYAQERC